MQSKDGFYIRCGPLILDLSASRTVGILHNDFWSPLLQEQREVFLFSFVLLLGQHGLYGLHATRMAKGGTAIFIAGASGCGKTSLTLSLAREGWRYSCDDTLMLRDVAGGIETLAILGAFSCGRVMNSQVPELGAPIGTARHLVMGKNGWT